jgi:hypothetical protein
MAGATVELAVDETAASAFFSDLDFRAIAVAP